MGEAKVTKTCSIKNHFCSVRIRQNYRMVHKGLKAGVVRDDLPQRRDDAAGFGGHSRSLGRHVHVEGARTTIVAFCQLLKGHGNGLLRNRWTHHWLLCTQKRGKAALRGFYPGYASSGGSTPGWLMLVIWCYLQVVAQPNILGIIIIHYRYTSCRSYDPCLWESGFDVDILGQERGKLRLQNVSECHGGSKSVAKFQTLAEKHTKNRRWWTMESISAATKLFPLYGKERLETWQDALQQKLSILRVELIASLRKLIAEPDVMHWGSFFPAICSEVEPA